MNDFGGLLASDFGFKPQGKSAPMAASKSSANLTPNSTLNFGIQSHGASRSSRGSNSLGGSFVDDHDAMFGSTSNRKTQDFGGIDAFGDVFGGPPKYTSTTESRGGDLAFNFDSVSRDSGVKSSSLPVYDEPVYDEDIFDGVPGLKSSASVKYDDVFSSISSPPKRNDGAFDELLGSFGGARPESKSSGGAEKDVADFDDLIPGFGGSSPSGDRPPSEASWPPKSTISATKTTSNVMEDPFVVLESTSPPVVPSSEPFIDPLEEISRLSKSGSSRVDDSSVSGGVSDDIDPLDGLGRSAPAFSSKKNDQGKDRSPLKTGPSTIETKTSARKESVDKSSVRSPESHSQKMSVDNYWESHQSLFDMPAVSNGFSNSVGQTGSPPSYVNASPNETNSQVNMSSTFEETLDSSEDVWLTVSEFPLFTQLTSAPPPSRPPPPRPAKVSKARIRTNVDERAYVFSGEEMQTNSDAAASAAAMKEAMDRAEAKFRHAKEVRERETAKAARSKEAVQLEKDEKAIQDAQERAFREREERLERERQQREREEEEGEQRELEQERERVREIEREKEEKEREQRRLEKERERVREIEREREKARQAVDRATKEARERAAAESRLKAERAAVQRAQAEARERAAADAKQRAERAAAEARERANANAEAREKEARERAAVARAETEARLRAERAAVQRAAAEARDRAAADARERATASAKVNQQKNENDLESFFSMGSRPSSAPRPRANSSDPLSDTQFQNRQGAEAARRTSVGSSSSLRKASSTTNIVDDLTSIFGAVPSSGEFQDVEGESEDRRRARLERHQRTEERAAKALAEKNQRDLQAQRDQAERHRIGETIDAEIKRWSAGKEGNLRALLSTLQYVLWPECGWQPVSLTDLITAASVKKVYRKATLCIHPDKVQQKGANLQQKYIAEKVFDLLKEAWNKFNSEELF